MSSLVGLRTWLEKYGLLVLAALIVWQGLDMLLNASTLFGDGIATKVIGTAAAVAGIAYIAAWTHESWRIRRHRLGEN